MVHICNEILLSYKRKCIWVGSNQMDEPGAYYTMWSKAGGERQILYINAYIWNLVEKEMAPQSSILSWRITETEEPGGLPSMGSHRVGYDWSDLAAAAAWNLERWYRWTYPQGRYGDTDIGDRLSDTVEEGESGTIWESSTETDILS